MKTFPRKVAKRTEVACNPAALALATYGYVANIREKWGAAPRTSNASRDFEQRAQN